MNFHIEGITDYIKPYNIKGKEILILSDIHFPFHNKRALNIALEYAKECDTILLNGDIVDFHGLAKFTKNPKRSFIDHEIDILFEFLQTIRKNFKGEIIYKMGNHEERLTTYLFNRAPALYGVEVASLRSMIEFREWKAITGNKDATLKEVIHSLKYLLSKDKDYEGLNITWIDSVQLMKVASLYILHGHEIFSGANTVNIARTYYLKAQENILMGHRHQTQDYFAKSIDGKIKGSFSVGCLSDLHPRWNSNNNWNHGFARVSKINALEFNVENHKIIHGKVY